VIAGFDRLYPDVPINYRFTEKIAAPSAPDAPIYTILSGFAAAREYEAAGFYFQQFDLWLSANGLGGIWLGLSRDNFQERPTDIITYAWGETIGSALRNPDEFNRKPIDQITNAPDDPCIQAAHLAPSGRNLQPWFFAKTESVVMVYRQAIDEVALGYRLADLDMGIALCHFAVAAAHFGQPFSFVRSLDLPAREGFLPFGVIN
jgi:nitroreductase